MREKSAKPETSIKPEELTKPEEILKQEKSAKDIDFSAKAQSRSQTKAQSNTQANVQSESLDESKSMHGYANNKSFKSDTAEKNSTGSGERPPITMDRYFAKEGVDALSHAFSGKLAVHPGVGGHVVAEEDLESTMEMLLSKDCTGKTVAYFHIPFCETHCLYCGFYTKAYNAEESKLFTDLLIKEMSFWEKKNAVNTALIHAVYLGGGTPTALEAEDLERLLTHIKKVLPLANDCEITVEGRLANFSEHKMESCLKGGANRFSLGVQTFDTEIRRTMKRIASQEELIKQLELLLSFNQAAVIIDLIYGFPNQTMQHWLRDLEIAHSLNLDGADCYQLNVYKSTPLGKAIENGKLPAGADFPMQSAMFAASVAAMQAKFYRRVSMSHWARTTRERNLYNLYLKGGANGLAFGPGAGGSLAGHFYIVQNDYNKWKEAVSAGKKPVMTISKPLKNASLYKAIAEGMEQGWLDLEKLEKTFGVPVKNIWQDILNQWEKVGLLTQTKTNFVLSLAGQFWYVNLSQLLQEYLKLKLEA